MATSSSRVRYCKAGSEVILVTAQGQSIRFSEKELRSASRISGGVRGIRLDPGDRVVAMDSWFRTAICCW